MSYCINPKCEPRYNQDDLTFCSFCHTPLLIQEKYRLLEPLREIDERANNEVFAVDAGGTTKVLKVLQNPKLVSMFEREAKTLQKLRHPGIPRVAPDGYFTFELNNGKKLHCLVMEKVEGQNLEQWLEKKKKLTPDKAVDWLIQLTEILDTLHQNDLFHRDLKLSNIMLKPDGQLALIDFGTVRQKTNTYLSKVGGGDRGDQVTAYVSPGYSPPEQIIGKAVMQSDFYALGRCFVHLLTGTHPLDLPEDIQTGKLIWSNSAPEVETWLANLIDDLIAPLPGKRPPNTSIILQRLEIEKDLPRQKQLFNWQFIQINRNLVLIVVNIVLLIVLVLKCSPQQHSQNLSRALIKSFQDQVDRIIKNLP